MFRLLPSFSPRVAQTLAELAQGFEGVRDEGSSADEDAGESAHPGSHRTPDPSDEHARLFQVRERAKRALPVSARAVFLIAAGRADPPDRSRARPVTLIGKCLVEKLHRLTGPHERHAVLRQRQLRLQILAGAHDLRQKVALPNRSPRAAHGEPDDAACAWSRRREHVARLGELLSEHRGTDPRLLPIFVEGPLDFAKLRLLAAAFVLEFFDRPPRVLALALRALRFDLEP